MILATRSQLLYPGKVALKRAIEAAQACGMNAVEIFPDGRIRITSVAAVHAEAANDFDRLEAKGLL